MSAPKQESWSGIKRLARYLLEKPRVIWRFGGDQGGDLSTIEVYSDSDRVGCRKSRKSTSGGVVVLGGSVLKSWSSTQQTVATTSGEAEFYALTKAAAEGLGVQSVAADLGYPLDFRIWWTRPRRGRSLVGPGWAKCATWKCTTSGCKRHSRGGGSKSERSLGPKTQRTWRPRASERRTPRDYSVQ